jgi:hypothetical protein
LESEAGQQSQATRKHANAHAIRDLERFPLRRSNAVTAVPGVVRAFVWREEVDRRGDQTADVLEVPWSRGPEERFQFGEGQFDRIEIRAVGRKESQVRARLLDGDPDLGLLVDDEVVEHDHIARPQGGHQHLLDIGEETHVIDGPIEHRRGSHALEAEGGDDRVRLPVAARRVIVEPRAARTPAIAP